MQQVNVFVECPASQRSLNKKAIRGKNVRILGVGWPTATHYCPRAECGYRKDLGMDLALTDKMKSSLKHFEFDGMCKEGKLPAKTVQALLERRLIIRGGPEVGRSILVLTKIGAPILEKVLGRTPKYDEDE